MQRTDLCAYILSLARLCGLWQHEAASRWRVL
jgi:hypothetical protein